MCLCFGMTVMFIHSGYSAMVAKLWISACRWSKIKLILFHGLTKVLEIGLWYTHSTYFLFLMSSRGAVLIASAACLGFPSFWIGYKVKINLYRLITYICIYIYRLIGLRFPSTVVPSSGSLHITFRALGTCIPKPSFYLVNETLLNLRIAVAARYMRHTWAFNKNMTIISTQIWENFQHKKAYFESSKSTWNLIIFWLHLSGFSSKVRRMQFTSSSSSTLSQSFYQKHLRICLLTPICRPNKFGCVYSTN